MRVDLGEQCFQVFAGELPLERTSGGAVVVLEAQQAIFEVSQGSKVVGSEQLALNDREVHLDLVQPTGMHRRMHWDDSGPTSPQAFDASLAAMRGAVVHDPEHPRSGSVGLLVHDLCDEAPEGADPGLLFTTAQDLGASDIPSGEIGPGAAALIFMLNAHRTSGCWGKRGMDTAARLDTGLLVRGDDAVSLAQRFSFPFSLVQVQHSTGFALESRIAREDPGSMRPRTDRILGKPAPECAITDRGYQAALDDLAADLRHAPARQRYVGLVRQLASQGLNGHYDAGGKRALGARCGIVPPTPADVLGKSACATY
jgi:hypothetical protein